MFIKYIFIYCVNKNIILNMKIKEFILATTNEHKVKEFQEIFKPYNIIVKSLKDENITVEVEETGETFKENALIKAQAISKLTNKIIISDDSGIIIEKMGNNMPGVYSHRFQNSHGGVKETNEFIIKNYAKSLAFYTCSICVLNLKEEPLSFEGYMYGTINDEIKGTNGFGYDPIFIPKGYNKTLGELDESIKNSISHRDNAINLFLNYLKENNLI